MKKYLTTIRFWFDYWIVEFLYGPFRVEQYQDYMFRRWGDRYKSRYIADVYVDTDKLNDAE